MFVLLKYTQGFELLIIQLLPPKCHHHAQLSYEYQTASSVGSYERYEFLKSTQDIFKNSLPGAVAHTCHPKTAQVKTGMAGIQDQPLLHEILSQQNKTKSQKTFLKIIKQSSQPGGDGTHL